MQYSGYSHKSIKFTNLTSQPSTVSPGFCHMSERGVILVEQKVEALHMDLEKWSQTGPGSLYYSLLSLND